jgi:hypothetical protein
MVATNVAPSIREMGPAARHETLNDHWNGWNFRKIARFRKCSRTLSLNIFLLIFYPGTTLLRRFNEAADMSVKQAEIFGHLSATFSRETVDKWERMVANWNANPKAPNPYGEPKSRELLCLTLFRSP